MIHLFPAGFEEVEHHDGVELVAYTDPTGEELLWQAFGGTAAEDVAEGWEERWKTFHRPVRVGPFWIGQSWQPAPEDALVVVVDPGRAFGTGAHPTTRLCLELLAILEPASLVDLGCGSGVLSVAAAKLGFDPVYAVDSDPQAVAATRDNARLNGVEVHAEQLDALTGALPDAEAGVANIARATVEQLAPLFRGRRLIASGYLESDPESLEGFRHLDRRTAEGWAADLYTR